MPGRNRRQAFGVGTGIGRFVRGQVQHGPVAVVIVDAAGLFRIDGSAAPQEGQVDDGILQALAGVDVDDLHQPFVTLQPQAVFIALHLFALHRFIQPLELRLDTVVFAPGALHQLRQLQQVGELALARGLGALRP